MPKGHRRSIAARKAVGPELVLQRAHAWQEQVLGFFKTWRGVVPIWVLSIRMIAFWGLYWGPRILEGIARKDDGLNTAHEACVFATIRR